MPVPDTKVNFDAETIDLDDYDDLLAVENQIDKALVAIAPPPEGFPGKFLWDTVVFRFKHVRFHSFQNERIG